MLVVDDDPAVSHFTAAVLCAEPPGGRPVELLTARSAAEARAVLQRRPDVAVALIDVVMETETAGLDLVAWMYLQPALAGVRVVVRSERPGRARVAELRRASLVDDFWDKAEPGVAGHRARLAALLGAGRLPRPAARWAVRCTDRAVLDDLADALPEAALLACSTTDGGLALVFSPDAARCGDQVRRALGRGAHPPVWMLRAVPVPALSGRVATLPVPACVGAPGMLGFPTEASAALGVQGSPARADGWSVVATDVGLVANGP